MDKKAAPSAAAGPSNDKVMAAVATLPIAGLVIYFAMPDASAYVKNYARQGAVIFGLSMILAVISVIPFVACIALPVNLILFVAWIVLLVQALQSNETYQLPVLGDLAAQILK